MDEIKMRHMSPDDFQSIIIVVNQWWGGRNMSDMLPKLFFVHFQPTSFVVEHDGLIVGFLVGFLSQTFEDEAYIHFVGVHPDFRKHGLGSRLYKTFIDQVRTLGRKKVSCVTAPVNKTSIRFHLSQGFMPKQGNRIEGDVSVVENYDGPGGDRVLFSKMI